MRFIRFSHVAQVGWIVFVAGFANDSRGLLLLLSLNNTDLITKQDNAAVDLSDSMVCYWGVAIIGLLAITLWTLNNMYILSRHAIAPIISVRV